MLNFVNENEGSNSRENCSQTSTELILCELFDSAQSDNVAKRRERKAEIDAQNN